MNGQRKDGCAFEFPLDGPSRSDMIAFGPSSAVRRGKGTLFWKEHAGSARG
jgi:hypothetical protein